MVPTTSVIILGKIYHYSQQKVLLSFPDPPTTGNSSLAQSYSWFVTMSTKMAAIMIFTSWKPEILYFY